MHLTTLAALAALIVLAGCQPYTPPPSVLSPQPLVPAAPPPPAPPPAPPAPAQGRYIGRTAVAYGGIDRACNPLTLTDFTVHGNVLRFGHFVGRIQPDGAVYMQAGQNYIEGHFIGSHFQGYYWSPPPNCTFDLSFDPEHR
jgi:hypothetical protein